MSPRNPTARQSHNGALFDLKTACEVKFKGSMSIDTLKAAIEQGTLRSKRTGPDGGGKYLVSETALDAWFDGLTDA